MAKKLAKIEKPEVARFIDKKKLYLVPLLFTWEGAPKEYVTKFNLCWQQIEEQLDNLEAKIGKINRVYHESIAAAGQEGLKIVERLSPASFKIANKKCRQGATFEPLEDDELVSESLDWQRILLVGFTSPKVAKIVTSFFSKATRKRYQHISDRISESLKKGEASLLFIREGHLVQFPKDLEVFSVSPPALDELHRWLKEQSVAKKEDAPEDKRPPADS